jgi:glycosyltransferase involved in cell wall biosynthesis
MGNAVEASGECVRDHLQRSQQEGVQMSLPTTADAYATGDHPVLFLVPDASRTGAPLALLHLLRWFKTNTDLQFRILLYRNGPLADDFAALAPTVTLTEVGVGRSDLVRRIGKLPAVGQILRWLWHHVVTPRAVNQPTSVVYANSVAAAWLLRQVSPPGLPLVVHVHELEHGIQTAAGPHGMATIKSLARRYVAVSRPVRENLVANHGIDPSLIECISSFLVIDELVATKSEAHRNAVRRSLNIADEAAVVAGCGATEWRKGVDLFAEMAGVVRTKLTGRPIHFVWVGTVIEDDFTHSVRRRIEELGLASFWHFVGEQPNPVEWFCGCDVFVLSSREEAMGLVALEAASVGKPIVCFTEAGGASDFVANECGRAVSPMTGEALAQAVVEIISSAELRKAMGRCAFQKVRRVHHIDVVAPRILKLIRNLS